MVIQNFLEWNVWFKWLDFDKFKVLEIYMTQFILETTLQSNTLYWYCILSPLHSKYSCSIQTIILCVKTLDLKLFIKIALSLTNNGGRILSLMKRSLDSCLICFLLPKNMNIKTRFFIKKMFICTTVLKVGKSLLCLHMWVLLSKYNL